MWPQRREPGRVGGGADDLPDTAGHGRITEQDGERVDSSSHVGQVGRRVGGEGGSVGGSGGCVDLSLRLGSRGPRLRRDTSHEGDAVVEGGGGLGVRRSRSRGDRIPADCREGGVGGASHVPPARSIEDELRRLPDLVDGIDRDVCI